jgi:hypothetical protein
VGERFGAERPAPLGGRESEQIVLRNSDGDWELAPGDLPDDRVFLGIVFSTADVAWVFGNGLLRSVDFGTSWEDMSDRVPLDLWNYRILDMTFRDEHVGFLAASTLFGFGPVVMRTQDGGNSWEALPVRSHFPSAQVALGVRGTMAILVQQGSDGASVRVEAVERPPETDDVVTLECVNLLDGNDALSTVGTRAWIAATRTDLRNCGPNWTPHIFFSAALEAPFIEQTLPVIGPAEIRTIDLRDDGTGVAGGFTLGQTFGPFLFYTEDAGATWLRSAITSAPRGVGIQSVLRARGTSAWAVTIDLEDGLGTTFLHTTDGGANWEHVQTSFDRNTQFRDLARNTERE